MMNKLLLLFIAAFIYTNSFAQCSTLGQTPSSAFPVCGTDPFIQASVPPCGGTQIPTNSCSDFLTDINPYWYRFTCYTAGTLGFVLTPNNAADDYDWQLFDITNHNANDVYTDASLFVACNWSGEPGTTGASSAGTSLSVCGSTPGGPFRPLFSTMPTLILGHEYILLVSHFSGNNQSGYNLSFGGGGSTASIVDPTQPGLTAARAICDGIQMTIKLAKKMKCSSLKADGSQFVITPAIAPIVSAVGINCTAGFDMDSILLTLASPVPPGVYSLTVKNDASGSNLLDNCNKTIPLGDNVSVTVFPLIPTPMDSLTKPLGCAPDVIQLVFNKPMLCSSIATNGSDFKISGGTAPVTVASATGICNADGLTNVILVKLAAPIQTKGNYTITLATGTDGNTILNECAKETPAGSFLPFQTKDTVSAAFNTTIHFGCKADTVLYAHDGRNEVTSWKWTFDNGNSSSSKDTSIIYATFGNKTATLIVSNGVCSDSSSAIINLDNAIKAAFESTEFACPDDPVTVKDKSTGHLTAWNWSFGNGNSSSIQSPPQQFYQPSSRNTYNATIQLIVRNNIGCSDTTHRTIKVVSNCYIAVPKAFSPNGDGLNDYLYPTNAYKARDLYFAIYNRNGQKLFETSNWTNKWDGTFKGTPQDPGTYVWFLRYTNTDTNQLYELKGSTVLLR